MAYGDKRRKGARKANKSQQFKDKRGGETIDGRCTMCGGVEGRHNKVAKSQQIYNGRTPTGRYKTVYVNCPVK
jgi:hypothetical protein